MSYVIKKGTEKKMELPSAKKNDALRQNPQTYPNTLTFFPLSEEAEELFQNINKNLFQLEKDLAYFSFAIQEVQEISCP